MDDQGIWASFHLASSVYQEAFGEHWRDRLTELGWETVDHKYKSGGHDQTQLLVGSYADVRALLLDRGHTDAMRLFNLRLMRKGPTSFSTFHCLDLADAALLEVESRADELIAEAEARVDEQDG